MRALVFDGTLSSVERPERALPGECLIRVSMAGICNTDLEITAGYMGFQGILGHEFVGVVEQGTDEWLGKRVVGEINVGCGECDFCRRQLSRHCMKRTTLGIFGRDGAFAETLSLPTQNLHLVPDEISDREATFVEPLAAACEIQEQLHVDPSKRICLIGDGKLAILISRVLALTGAEVTAVGHHTEKLALMPVSKRMTAEEFIGERSFDIVIEASGNPSGWEMALGAIKPRGTLVLKSTYAGSFDFNPAPLVIDEINLLGSRCGPFAPAIRLLQNGLVRVDDLITAVFLFSDALSAFENAREKESLKVLMQMT